ncbi:high affinity immunoglobulin epsilon receptor subunit beta isoform X3 [Cricetulus griseus]|uniref:high affinity immunoglobulin epsilon receptor subunit beta isoform X3 n=1 Tax=Cricetulus griseus TaxID=10029 RepID=UPI0015C3432E|nr:high affinity immunoglobulin epsilon receptor subunit beta isoform X3 [Cricetulus griseus]XP_035297281.1 high affinity immunoglobulin epsilon receptor subunit beta isoform X3 [Cricetulus griseus]
MDAENKSRADLALPNPQESPSAPDIELLEVSPAAEALPAKPAPPPPQQTWQTVLKSDLEFLGVTQILFVLSGFLSVMSERKNTLYLDLNEDDGCFVTAFITVTDDRLYEELNVYSPIYSELEDKGETSSPVGS